MSFSLQHTTALVTGATDGLGKKIALELARNGVNLIVHGRNQQKLDSVIAEIKTIAPSVTAESVVCDLSNLAEIESAFTEIKKIDILINNAGVWLEGNTSDAAPEKVIELLHVNLGAPMLLTRKLLPVLQQSKFAQILNVSSISGVEVPPGDHYHAAVYTATKFGIQAFTESLAKEFENKNVRVMGYYPGGMETGIFVKAGNGYKAHEPWMFDPQESAEAIVFMLTRDPKITVKRMDLITYLMG